MRRMRARVIAISVWLSACGGGEEPARAPEVRMDFAREGGFFAAPFPCESRRLADGSIDVGDFPNSTRASFVTSLLGILAGDARGFGTTSTIYFALDAPLGSDVAVSYAESLAPSAPVYLVSADPDAADAGVRYPVEARFLEDGGPFGEANLLSLLPLQGVPLRPGVRYAAVVERTLGGGIDAAPAMRDLIEGRPPAGMSDAAFDEYRRALDALETSGVALDELASVAVFRTDDPTAGFARAVTAALGRPLPALEAGPAQTEVFDDYCVYEGALAMPVYQQGAPPFETEGGAWILGPDGAPILQGDERARIVITVPRAPMPAAGYPTVVFSRTGGGGDRPLVDRGARAAAGGDAIEPGSGPAREFAQVGFAGVSIDGPHGGFRNVTGGDEQLLIFNVQNPVAMRDNIRQSALELVLAAHVVPEIVLDTSDCVGAPAETHFDGATLVLMGHSMGATIAPLTLAFEPRYRAALLSGAGGSWIENIVYKESPLRVRPIAETLLGVAGRWELHEHDPVLMLLQWAGESADPPAYGRLVVREPIGAPRHVLMMQGIVDTYILPPIANATSLSFGLDLAGPALDETEPRLEAFAPLRDHLALAGREAISLPASANYEASVTAVVTQHPEDGIEDGHEVVFQTEPPKRQYRCFLETLAAGEAPTVCR